MNKLRGALTLGYYFGTMSFVAAYITLFCKERAHAHRLLRKHAQLALRIGGLVVKLEGTEHLPSSGGFVAVYNETSWPDMIALQAQLWGDHIDRGAGASEYGLIPFMTSACKVAGIALVPRGNRDKVDLVLANLVASLKAGDRVMFGGEGRMSGIDGVLRFKRGAALLAIRSGKPLIPLAFHGGQQLMPWKSLNLQSGTIHIRFGLPLATAGLLEPDARDLADKAQLEVTNMYNHLGQES